MLGRAPGQPVVQAAYQAEDTSLNALQPAAGPQQSQAAYPQPMPQAYAPMPYQAGYPMYPTNALSTLEGNQQALQQRLERIEQALLRLDKRMQLVERNELGRMSGANPASVPTTPDVLGQAPTAIPLAQTVRQAMREDWGSDILPPSLAAGVAQAPEAPPYAAGFAPVSQVDTTIRSTLQAAPNRLPSLADQTPAAAGRIPQSAGNMAVWTVRYEPSKVWPDRSQLAASRGVVELLRNSQTVTLVARGPNPTRPEFQERVRALSRYLSKVAALETVPISTLATPQLDADTIEVLATP
ncbi:MAG: hypothetical protein INF43_00330 [Alphaproteobacteria bacterium]|nr:hypothetical protein [Alphaproteobacteria bacterium]